LLVTKLKAWHQEHLSNILQDAKNTDSRISFYADIHSDTNYEMASYLKHPNPRSLLKGIVQIRTGQHILPISTGRNTRPITIPMERKCQICSTEIGNEYHFLLHCPAIDDTARIDYFHMVNKYLPPIKDRDTYNLIDIFQ